MSETKFKNYKGNCHCGAFRFEVNLPEIDAVTACNCSICSKKGYLLVLPAAGQLKIISGDDILTRYEFAANTITHKVGINFCVV
jgi:hypothetical protein